MDQQTKDSIAYLVDATLAHDSYVSGLVALVATSWEGSHAVQIQGDLDRLLADVLMVEACRSSLGLSLVAKEMEIRFTPFLEAVDWLGLARDYLSEHRLGGVEPVTKWITPPAAEVYCVNASRVGALVGQCLSVSAGLTQRASLKPVDVSNSGKQSLDECVQGLVHCVDKLKGRACVDPFENAAGLGVRQLSGELLAVLEGCTASDKGLKLGGGYVDPKLLAQFKRVMQSAGGVYTRDGLFTFDFADPVNLRNAMILSRSYVDRRDLGAFFTPKDLAKDCASLLELEEGMSVFDPNGGGGALLMAAKECGAAHLHACEIQPRHAQRLRDLGVEVREGDFLSCQPDGERFDRVFMNPPFSRDQDAAHMAHAMQFLKPDGRLVCIAAPSACELIDGLLVHCKGKQFEVDGGMFAAEGYVGAVRVLVFDACNLPQALLQGDGEIERERMRA